MEVHVQTLKLDWSRYQLRGEGKTASPLFANVTSVNVHNIEISASGCSRRTMRIEYIALFPADSRKIHPAVIDVEW